MTIPIDKTYTVHLPLDRSANEPPIMTIVLTKADSGYKMGISVCSPKDQFNKKLGRKIAYGRMHSAPVSDIDHMVRAAMDIAIIVENNRDKPVTLDIKTIFNTLEDRMKNK